MKIINLQILYDEELNTIVDIIDSDNSLTKGIWNCIKWLIDEKFITSNKEGGFTKNLIKVWPKIESDINNSTTGIVYIIKDEIGNIKIGITTDLKRRLKVLSSGTSLYLELLHHYIARNAKMDEEILHDKFQAKRIKGEWFKLSDTDLNWLLSINTSDELLQLIRENTKL